MARAAARARSGPGYCNHDGLGLRVADAVGGQFPPVSFNPAGELPRSRASDGRVGQGPGQLDQWWPVAT